MTETCRIFNTEYRHQFKKKSQTPRLLFIHSDCFADRIKEDWQIDPRLASVPTKFDKTAEKLVHQQTLDNIRTVYQISYKDPWSEDKKAEITGEEKEKSRTLKEINFQSELFAHITKLYFHPHKEKVLAPPATSKRIFGYLRPEHLHGGLSMYQEIHGRTGGLIMLQNAALLSNSKKTKGELTIKKQVNEEETDCSTKSV